MKVNQEWIETKLKVKYKFNTSHGRTFKWMNSIALTSLTTIVMKTLCWTSIHFAFGWMHFHICCVFNELIVQYL